MSCPFSHVSHQQLLPSDAVHPGPFYGVTRGPDACWLMDQRSGRSDEAVHRHQEHAGSAEPLRSVPPATDEGHVQLGRSHLGLEDDGLYRVLKWELWSNYMSVSL